MRFTVQLVDLLPAVIVLSDFVPIKDSSGAFTSIRVIANDNFVSLAFSSQICFVNIKVPATVLEVGDLSLQFDPLNKAVRSFSPLSQEGIGTESLSFELNERGILLKACSLYKEKKSYSRRLIPVSPSFVPMLKSVEGMPSVDINADLFSSVLKGIIVSASVQDGGSDSGVRFLVEGSNFVCASTNRVTLTEAGGENDSSIDGSLSCVLDSPMVAKIVKTIVKMRDSEYDSVTLFFSDNALVVSFAGVFLKAAISTLVFPDYEPLFQGFKNHFDIEAKILSENIRNLAFSASKSDDYRVSLFLKSGQLSVFSNESENSGINIEGFLGELAIDFNCFLLEPIVSNAGYGVVRIWFKDNISPVYLEFIKNDIKIRSLVASLG